MVTQQEIRSGRRSKNEAQVEDHSTTGASRMIVEDDEHTGSSSSEDDYGGSDDEASYMVDGERLDLQATAESLMAQQKEDGMSPQVEGVLDLLIWGIPFSALFVLLDIMIQQQYAMHPTLLIEIGRMMGTIPILMAILWFTTIRPFARSRVLQLLFFSTAVTCGCSFVWTYHESPFQVVMRRTPPLGCLWIYSIVKLDLLPCVTSLAIVALFIWQHNLPIIYDRI
ncbi:hypothetical protein BDZ90DRAFT_231459 [Jaminaea rosea]|uniref:DUF7719 domain-containing protein n=1 Tax=Jaminaea rosea TaxID=1569628 RepID=A0A316UX30_9BASI|nr:hypothetical protein BDZ90DRAFT_231459 [Jaminaea rosea]PWN28473.1 hypothetical protein BDZ90DRAFT_231459 [Jaminaea rosea]